MGSKFLLYSLFRAFSSFHFLPAQVGGFAFHICFTCPDTDLGVVKGHLV